MNKTLSNIKIYLPGIQLEERKKRQDIKTELNSFNGCFCVWTNKHLQLVTPGGRFVLIIFAKKKLKLTLCSDYISNFRVTQLFACTLIRL